MTKRVIETVTFKLNDQVSAADFLRHAAASTTYVQGCKGFVARRLSASPEGQWIEHIEWESMADATAAAAGLGDAPGIGPFLSAIQEDSVTIHHTDLALSLG